MPTVPQPPRNYEDALDEYESVGPSALNSDVIDYRVGILELLDGPESDEDFLRKVEELTGMSFDELPKGTIEDYTYHTRCLTRGDAAIVAREEYENGDDIELGDFVVVNISSLRNAA